MKEVAIGGLLTLYTTQTDFRKVPFGGGLGSRGVVVAFSGKTGNHSLFFPFLMSLRVEVWSSWGYSGRRLPWELSRGVCVVVCLVDRTGLDI